MAESDSNLDVPMKRYGVVGDAGTAASSRIDVRMTWSTPGQGVDRNKR
jgi:hypothetical protein